jgi:hypothetical protein
MATKRTFRYTWLWEQFEDRADYIRKHMFGAQAVYLSGRLMFLVSERPEPWGGLICPTEREQHASLLADFPFLSNHPVLGKWLYLTAAGDNFDDDAQQIIEAILRGDKRFGVEPPLKRQKLISPRRAPQK